MPPVYPSSFSLLTVGNQRKGRKLLHIPKLHDETQNRDASVNDGRPSHTHIIPAPRHDGAPHVGRDEDEVGRGEPRLTHHQAHVDQQFASAADDLPPDASVPLDARYSIAFQPLAYFHEQQHAV